MSTAQSAHAIVFYLIKNIFIFLDRTGINDPRGAYQSMVIICVCIWLVEF